MTSRRHPPFPTMPSTTMIFLAFTLLASMLSHHHAVVMAVPNGGGMSVRGADPSAAAADTTTTTTTTAASLSVTATKGAAIDTERGYITTRNLGGNGGKKGMPLLQASDTVAMEYPMASFVSAKGTKGSNRGTSLTGGSKSSKGTKSAP
jgi:hypothetical protein